MVAKKNPIMDGTDSSIYSIFHDGILLEQIRARDEAIAHENYLRKQMEEHIRARDEAIAHENYVRRQMEKKDKQLDQQAKQLNQQSKQINVLSKQRDEDALLIAKLLKENEELRRNQK